ncbi:MAG: transcriptional repressor LexA [Parachlamydia sp.]|jgi:repressor LexA|nr:transcriptional repressor LexA [Parachlamydia sp.]
MKGLTSRQQAILAYIKEFIEKHSYSPSYREIMHHFSFTSPGSVYKHVKTLQRKGYLESEKQASRSIIPTQYPASPSGTQELELSLIGNIAAGYPIEIFMCPQKITLPAALVPQAEITYVLRVHGNGFYEEAIQDGDLLLVETRQEVHAGETIIGVINQHNTIIKKYYPEGQYIRLESCHPEQNLTLRHDHLVIQGVLAGLLRYYF